MAGLYFNFINNRSDKFFSLLKIQFIINFSKILDISNYTIQIKISEITCK